MSRPARRAADGILLVRLGRARPRLFSSAAVGLAMIGVLYALTDWRPATRLLVAWDLATALYLVLTFEMMGHSGVERIRQQAAEQDEGQLALLVLTVAAALASVGAIFA